jgi:hypothetical protein
MSRAPHYRAQADHARRLAEITVQPNLERELHHVAEELNHLAKEIASDDTDFLRSEVLEPRDLLRVNRCASSCCKTVPLGTWIWEIDSDT